MVLKTGVFAGSQGWGLPCSPQDQGSSRGLHSGPFTGWFRWPRVIFAGSQSLLLTRSPFRRLPIFVLLGSQPSYLLVALGLFLLGLSVPLPVLLSLPVWCEPEGFHTLATLWWPGPASRWLGLGEQLAQLAQLSQCATQPTN